MSFETLNDIQKTQVDIHTYIFNIVEKCERYISLYGKAQMGKKLKRNENIA